MTEAPETQPDDKGDEEKHRREEHRSGRECIDPDHLSDIDAVYGAEQRLQDVAQHHRREEAQNCLPKRWCF
jgi:hypothetical protein